MRSSHFIKSWLKWWLIREAAMNDEGNRPPAMTTVRFRTYLYMNAIPGLRMFIEGFPDLQPVRDTVDALERPFVVDNGAGFNVFIASPEVFPLLVERQRLVVRSPEDATVIVQEGYWGRWEVIYDKACRFLTSGDTVFSAPELAGTNPSVYINEWIFARFTLHCPAAVAPVLDLPYTQSYMAMDPAAEWTPSPEAVTAAYDALIIERDLVPRTHLPVYVPNPPPSVPRLPLGGGLGNDDGAALSAVGGSSRWGQLLAAQASERALSEPAAEPPAADEDPWAGVQADGGDDGGWDPKYLIYSPVNDIRDDLHIIDHYHYYSVDCRNWPAGRNWRPAFIEACGKNRWAVNLQKCSLTDALAETRADELRAWLAPQEHFGRLVVDSFNAYGNPYLSATGLKMLLDVLGDESGLRVAEVKRIKVYGSCSSSGDEAMSVLAKFIRKTGLHVGELHVTEMGVTDAGLEALLEALDYVKAYTVGPIWLQVRNNRLTEQFVEDVLKERGGCLGQDRSVCGTMFSYAGGCGLSATTRYHLFGGMDRQRPWEDHRTAVRRHI